MGKTANRQRKEVILPPKTRDAANKVLAKYADADARMAQINAKIDEQITKIKNKYSDELEELGEVKETTFAQIQTWAENQPKLFAAKKSIDMLHGSVGFRTGTPKLQKARRYTWENILEILKAKGKTDFYRTKEVVNKEQFIDTRSKEETQVLMKQLQLDVVQSETFFVKLIKEE